MKRSTLVLKALPALFAILIVSPASAIRPPIEDCASGRAEGQTRNFGPSGRNTEVCLCKSWRLTYSEKKGTICEEDAVIEALSIKYKKIAERETNLPPPYDFIPCFVMVEEKTRTVTAEATFPTQACSSYVEPEEICLPDTTTNEYYYLLDDLVYDEVEPFTSYTWCLKSTITRTTAFDPQICPAPYSGRVSGYNSRSVSTFENFDGCPTRPLN